MRENCRVLARRLSVTLMALLVVCMAWPALASGRLDRNGLLVYGTYTNETPDCGACPDETGNETLWTVRPDGSGRRRLGPGVNPIFSPRGERLVFEWPGEFESAGVAISRPDGSRRRRLTRRADTFPGWAPRGNRLAFTRVDRIGTSLHVIDLRGGRQRTLVASPYLVDWSWSPGGTSLVYGRGRQIFTVRANGTARRRLNNGLSPVWSKYGWIAFTQRPKQRGYRLLVMRTNGTDVHEIVPESSPSAPWDWSPVRPRIAYGRRGAVYVADMSGRATPIASGQEQICCLSWSPDGRLIAYATSYDPPEDGGTLYVVPSTGGSVTRLAGDAGSICCQLRWSPDGKLIAFLGRGESLNVVAAASGASRQVARTGGWPHFIGTFDWQALPR